SGSEAVAVMVTVSPGRISLRSLAQVTVGGWFGGGGGGAAATCSSSTPPNRTLRPRVASTLLCVAPTMSRTLVRTYRPSARMFTWFEGKKRTPPPALKPKSFELSSKGWILVISYPPPTVRKGLTALPGEAKL